MSQPIAHLRRRYEHGIIGVQYFTVVGQLLVAVALVLVDLTLADRSLGVAPQYFGIARLVLIVAIGFVLGGVIVLSVPLKTDREGHLLPARAVFVMQILSVVGATLVGLGFSSGETVHSGPGVVMFLSGLLLLLNGLAYCILRLLDCGLQRVYGLEASD